MRRMKRRIVLIAAVCGLMLTAAAQGEIRTVTERNQGRGATGKFKFKNIPSPSRTDAAANASFSIIDGRRDINGRTPRALRDGRLPDNADQPGANFFFAQGAKGGRIVADLGRVVAVKRISTYSWHRRSRGPQVYRLYAADGSAKDFNTRPVGAIAPDRAGWTLIAEVDTRPKTGDFGGQYAASIFDSAGAAIGSFRYLLFDVTATETVDIFGNTFFSEIDVYDGKVHKPAPTPGLETVSIPGGCRMTLDYSEMPELKQWIDKSLKPACVKWYPLIAEMLSDDGYKAPQHFSITFRANMRGVAATGGVRIYCAGRWFTRNLHGQAVGAVVHEMVHVVQQYRRVRGGRPNPGWMVEGVADYIRWFGYEPKSKRPRVNPARAKYTDSYRTTGAFLNYLVNNVDKDIVRKFNSAMRKGKYSPDLWKQYTGKTVDQLWADFIRTLNAKKLS